LEELNANKSRSISSALDFFGDNVKEDNSGNPSETTINSKNKERKQVKRKSKDPEEIQVKKSKLKSSTKYHCM